MARHQRKQRHKETAVETAQSFPSSFLINLGPSEASYEYNVEI